MTLIIFEIIGIIGAVALLVTYFLLSTQKIESNSYKYHGLNFGAAFLLTLNAIYIQSIPFALINIFWSIISLIGIFRVRNENNKNDKFKKK